MAPNEAVPFWRAAGMTYITYSNICANLARNCLQEPYKSEVLGSEKVHFSLSVWKEGKPSSPYFAQTILKDEGPEFGGPWCDKERIVY